jgi:hypothetical protein
MPVALPVPLVVEPARFDELLRPEPVEPVPDVDGVWVTPPVVVDVPLHGRPLAPIRPVLLGLDAVPDVLPAEPEFAGLLGLDEFAVLGFEVLGFVELGFIVL